MKLINICGARPNFIKIAPLMRAYRQVDGIEPILVHTGQHYDAKMSRLFFDELKIPEPDLNLEVGSGSHALQAALIMQRFEPVVLEIKPDAVLVVGDVNSTIACALVAAKLGVGVFHVEAGLRSFDRTMPEEINRVLTDAISDLLFVSEPSGIENLRREGVAEDKVHFVGNVMIDTLERSRERAEESKILEKLGLSAGQYAVVTLHRPASVDRPKILRGLLGVFDEIQRDMPMVFPIHPRTRKQMAEAGLDQVAVGMKQFRLVDPLGYLDFLRLMANAAVVLTDSGGIQEETTILGVPCLTLRENTERPITITQGTNRLVGMDPARVLEGYRRVRNSPPAPGRRPDKWDGRAAQRIAQIITGWKR
ncbi:MAG TPA: UDP-N-acetylglucosamine 2-epimerase (non-hydrolyzing) [Phycisphaerae bacterium]|nr:UDP-N-acetylglucosamine 2-epimerase (non-hydrolyzing) [Phycisphaerae bacterium]